MCRNGVTNEKEKLGTNEKEKGKKLNTSKGKGNGDIDYEV